MQHLYLSAAQNVPHLLHYSGMRERVIDARFEAAFGNAKSEPVNGQPFVFLKRGQIAGPAIGDNDDGMTDAAVLMGKLPNQFLNTAEVRIKRAGKKGDVHGCCSFCAGETVRRRLAMISP